MLLLHATRAQMALEPLRFRWRFWIATTALITAVYFAVWKTQPIQIWSCRSAGLAVFLIVVGVQMARIVAARWDRFETISSFYLNLAQKRASRRTPEWVPDYIESYRHLREHGNAFAILFLEFALGLVLASAPHRVVAILAVVLWLLPSTCSWYIGSLLETELPDPSND
jgi:hypothetical protein